MDFGVLGPSYDLTVRHAFAFSKTLHKHRYDNIY
jgi:hypothetical protein